MGALFQILGPGLKLVGEIFQPLNRLGVGNLPGHLAGPLGVITMRLGFVEKHGGRGRVTQRKDPRLGRVRSIIGQRAGTFLRGNPELAAGESL